MPRPALAIALLLVAALPAFAADPPKKEPPKVTQPADLALPPGFEAELLLVSDAPTQGSWINLGKDKKGRLLIGCQQNQPPLRVTLDKDGKVESVEKLDWPITQIMGFLEAYESLYVNGAGPQGFGLYRLRDADGDGKYEDVKFLKRFVGSGEHGPHGVALGPDGKIYVINGNHTDVPEGMSPNSPHKNYREDHLLPRQWDANGHAVGKLAPGGYVVRTDADGKEWEFVLGGFRNAYDIAFNGDGELFTFDSDMEWDWGMPWYRPTRVNHCVSASESGWRSGTGKWPDYYPDSLPATVNVGIGSPVGVTSGAGAKFPAKYQKAVYILDWTYGRIFAVHLTPDGASYKGELEEFVAPKGFKGNAAKKPLPLTDAIVGDDGAMYFTIGGRNNQAALYRVRYTGTESTAPADLKNAAGGDARTARRALEVYHGKADPKALEAAWPQLANADRFIRYAARIAVESQPVASWKTKATAEKEARPALAALLALARLGAKEDQPAVLAALEKFPLAKLPADLQLEKLRVLGVSFARHGLPAVDAAKKIIADADPLFPSASEPLNREIALVLIYLNAPGIAGKCLKQAAAAKTQEDQLYYVFHLRSLPVGFWTTEQRKQYLSYFGPDRPKLPHPPETVAWFAEAGRAYSDGASFNNFLKNILKDALAGFSESERAACADIIAKLDKAALPPPEPPARAVVKAWAMADVLPTLDKAESGRDFEKGKQAYVAAQCAKCHRFGDAGGAVGPDLTAVATRFDRKALLESILEPSKVVSDQYQNEIITTQSGKQIVGRVVDESADSIAVQPQPLSPDRVIVKKDDLESRTPSKLSPMPEHLADVLTAEELLDLLAYLESGGRKDFRAFSKK